MDAASVTGPGLPSTADVGDTGEFRVTAVLGQGGSGVVYDATWGPRRVALKVLHANLLGTDRVRAQFLEEARRLQAIAHPAVVKVLACGELPDGRPYLAMERLEGETLSAILARGPLPLGDAVALFEELAAAVGALHDRGLVHRDLKPENVYIVRGRHAVLLDFGITKELAAPASTTTMDGGVRGTPAYMAPERFFGQPAGIATDLYELAVTFYAMLAGRLPWDDLADPEARLSPRPLVELASVPSELDIEIRRAMSTRAQNRPASAKVFSDAIRATLATAELGDDGRAPGETARMRPSDASAPSATTAQGAPKAWFADRHATTDRGKTPLAWAPTEAAPVRPAPRARHRSLLIAGTLGALAIAGGIAAWQISRRDPAPPAPVVVAQTAAVAVAHDAAAAADPDDPWAQTPQPVAPDKTIAIDKTATDLTPEQARAQIAKAIVHVPADTRVLFTVSIDELRANEHMASILDKASKRPEAQLLLAAAPCIPPILGGAQWAIYAAKSLHESTHGTLIVRGRWKRADVEKCFADDMVPLAMPDGETMLQLRRVGWVDFLDDHTVYISVRDDLAAAQVHDLAKRGKGPAAHTRALLAKLPAARTSAFVIDGDAKGTKLVWPKDYLPAGSDASGFVRFDAGGGATFEVVADTHDATSAKAVTRLVKQELDQVFQEKASALLGEISVEQAATTMRIGGTVTPLLIAMIAGQI